MRLENKKNTTGINNLNLRAYYATEKKILNSTGNIDIKMHMKKTEKHK